MLQQMVQELNRISFIPLDEVRRIEPFLTKIRLMKGQLFIGPNDFSKKIAYVQSGLLKSYYTTLDGKEYISSFVKNGEFIAAYFEIQKGLSSKRFIQALEDTDIFCVHYDDYTKLNASSVYWADLGRKVIQKKLAEQESKERDLMLKTAEERYYKFMREEGELFDRLPQNQIALYLGINPSTLSRLKKKVS